MVERHNVTFGIKTAPQHDAGYEAIARVWEEADATPELDHAWLWDHMLPLGGDAWGHCLENWTLIGALAAQTTRLRIGHLVTSNLYRSPPVLAKMATTVDIISGGRLSSASAPVGHRPSRTPTARRAFRRGADRPPAEACQIIRRA
jgi:alkanesulfonate monooxygenase SsuD/methylene tetrahydromethanopterin reductase-like flavin-dependent oxidoreductase (luciferase family)